MRRSGAGFLACQWGDEGWEARVAIATRARSGDARRRRFEWGGAPCTETTAAQSAATIRRALRRIASFIPPRARGVLPLGEREKSSAGNRHSRSPCSRCAIARRKVRDEPRGDVRARRVRSDERTRVAVARARGTTADVNIGHRLAFFRRLWAISQGKISRQENQKSVRSVGHSSMSDRGILETTHQRADVVPNRVGTTREPRAIPRRASRPTVAFDVDASSRARVFVSRRRRSRSRALPLPSGPVVRRPQPSPGPELGIPPRFASPRAAS